MTNLAIMPIPIFIHSGGGGSLSDQDAKVAFSILLLLTFMCIVATIIYLFIDKKDETYKKNKTWKDAFITFGFRFIDRFIYATVVMTVVVTWAILILIYLGVLISKLW